MCRLEIWTAKRQKDLLGVVTQRVLGLQHPPGHEGVEDGRPGQRHAEVEAEEPPVLHPLIELMEGGKKRVNTANDTILAEAQQLSNCV